MRLEVGSSGQLVQDLAARRELVAPLIKQDQVRDRASAIPVLEGVARLSVPKRSDIEKRIFRVITRRSGKSARRKIKRVRMFTHPN